MFIVYAAQQAIQAATGLVPSQPQTRSEAKAEGGHRSGQAAAPPDMQNDILHAVAQILTQSQQVTLNLYMNTLVTYADACVVIY